MGATLPNCGRPLIRDMPANFGQVVDRRPYGSHAWSMTDKPRLQLLHAKALARQQWWIVGVATLVGVFGLTLCPDSGGRS